MPSTETTATARSPTSQSRPVWRARNTASASRRADYDGDGLVDLYVLNYGPNTLYHNNGNGTFTDVTEKSGLGCPLWSLSAPWFDYNNDGRPDVYVANYLQYDSGKFRSFYAAAGYPGPLSYNGTPSLLYRNNGDGTFTDVTKEAGVYQGRGTGHERHRQRFR